jgi:hypothetical protein
MTEADPAYETCYKLNVPKRMGSAQYNNLVMKRDHCCRLLDNECSFLFEIYCLVCIQCSTELIEFKRFEI